MDFIKAVEAERNRLQSILASLTDEKNKLEKQIAGITSELKAIDVYESARKPKEVKKKERKAQKCGQCGSPDHNKRNCPEKPKP